MLVTDFLILLKNSTKFMFKFETINNKKILKSDFINSCHCFFTTRQSVVTPKEINELTALCSQNLEEIAKYIGVEKTDIIVPEQTHSANIAIAQKGKTYPNTDALVVEDPNLAILLNFADCTPVILYDEAKNTGAIAHAGWRGTAQSIAAKTAQFMIDKYSSKPENITAIIGPAISMKNYQVDKDVFDKVSATLKNTYNDYYIYDSARGKYNIDLKTVNYHQLKELGLLRIDKCNYCTYDSVDVFFSYRKEHGKTARHSAVLKLK